jgi:uncharacterized membrane protein
MSSLLNIIKRNKYFVVSNTIFLVIYSLICFVNHYNFRTYALDLGLYTRVLYDYSHFHFSYGEVFHNIPENMLGDHFDLLLMLFSPLYWVFGNSTLLIVQLAAIHIGAWGLYKLAQSSKLTKTISALVCIVFLSSFGIFSAVGYDYHSNVVAACLLPWFVLFFKEKKHTKSILIFMLILVAKENMALWLFFICTGFLVLYKEKAYTKVALVFSFFSIAYFIVVVFLLMPSLSLIKNYNHFEFHILGNSFKEVVFNMVQHPVKAILLLFESPLPDEKLRYIKAETWFFWLISGGFLFFYRPVFLWMLIPIMMQKMYHDDSGKWSISGQYNIEFAPLAALCLIEILKTTTEKKQAWLSTATVFLSIAVTIRLCDHTISFVDKTRIRFYQESHYQSDFNNKEVYGLMNKIPKNAIVSAEGMFVPHLINRKMVYQFPIVKDAQYILLSDDNHSYPLTKENMLKKIDSLNSSPNWSHTPQNSHLYLFEIIEKH